MWAKREDVGFELGLQDQYWERRARKLKVVIPEEKNVPSCPTPTYISVIKL